MRLLEGFSTGRDAPKTPTRAPPDSLHAPDSSHARVQVTSQTNRFDLRTETTGVVYISVSALVLEDGDAGYRFSR